MKTVKLRILFLLLIILLNSCKTFQFSNENFPNESQKVISIIMTDSIEVKFDEKGGNVYLNSCQVEGKLINGEKISKTIKEKDEIYFLDKSYIK